MENKNFKLKIKKKTLALIDWANVYGWKKKLKWEVCPEKLFSFLSGYHKIIDKRFYYGEEKGQGKSENFRKKIEEIGYTPIFKEIKWVPVYLEEQNHFKEILKQLFNVLDNITKTNSEISVKLYEFRDKFKNDMFEDNSVDESGNEYHLVSKKNLEVYKQIYQLVEEFDSDLSKLNIDIKELQESLKKPCFRRKCDFDVEITRDVFDLMNEYETLLLFSGDGDYSALAKYLVEKNKKVILVFGLGCKGKEYDEIKSKFFYACSVIKLKKELEKIDSEESSESMCIPINKFTGRD